MTLAPFAGFVGNELQVQETTNSALIRFRLGITDRYRNAQGEFVERETFWVTCQAWGHLARRIGQEVTKGDAVLILGRWEQSNYEKDGEKKTARFVTVEHLGLDMAVPQKKQQNDAAAPAAPAGNAEVENPL